MKINNLYKKALFLAVICLFIGAGVMPSISSDEPVSKGTIYVDDDADPSWYDATHVKTIQEGIDDASSDYTVFVYNGTYCENVIVDKTIDLIGEDRNNTIIDSEKKGNVINITANGVKLCKFTITNSTINQVGIRVFTNSNNISSNNIKENHNGIILDTADNNVLMQNNICNNSGGIGFYFWYSDHNKISKNIISYNSQGIGGHYSSNNQIIFNKIFSNHHNGMEMSMSNHYNISSNNISFNGARGITIYSNNHNNTISNNYIYGNNMDGIYIGSSSNNDIILYHNFFINNNQNAVDYSNNIWYNPLLQEGNYWSDYYGHDADGDGIGETPYDIPGGSNQDLYPIGSFDNIPETVYVDDNYSSSIPGWQYDYFDMIQDGIDAVAENGTVYVYNGTYYENVVVDKTINLIGEDRNGTIIDGGGSGDVVYVSANWVNISGFTIQNSGGSGTPNLDAGIDLRSSYNTVMGNTITNNEDGIGLSSSNYDIIIYNTLSNNDDGVSLVSSGYNNITGNYIPNNDDGISLKASSNNNDIIGNNITFSTNGGIGLISSSDNTISLNRIKSNNNHGIRLSGSTCSNNVINSNSIPNNSNKGVYIWNYHGGMPNDNIIYHNNFINNNPNAYDECSNTWDNGYPSGGNYWSDYTGTDYYHGSYQNSPGSDGIGDTPNPITGGSNLDNYPLMQPWNGTSLPVQEPIIVYVDNDYIVSTPGWQYDHFDVIQDGIDVVAENGTVYVYNGTYNESINIGKSINLIGENKNTTIIDPYSSGDVVRVEANFTSICNFSITSHCIESSSTNGICIENFHNLTIDNCICFEHHVAIEFFDSDNTIINNTYCFNNYLGLNPCQSNFTTITNNDFSDNYWCGIRSWKLHNSTILNNTCNNAHDNGIRLKTSNNNYVGNNICLNNGGGIWLMGGAKNNTVIYNLCAGNTNGISIWDTSKANNIISSNNCTSNNLRGIWLVRTEKNIVVNNTVTSNPWGGIAVTDSNNNTIYHNNIENNGDSTDNDNNYWDNGYPSGGNYFDDYTGMDNYHGVNQDILGSDGIGDKPYNISGGSNQDNYPFMHQYGWLIELDVNQSTFNRGFPIRHAVDGDWAGAQNFTPTLDTLTSVDIYLRKFGTPEFDLTVELREDDPQGTLLDTLVFTPGEVASSWTWLNVDFDDVNVGVGSDVFIVLPPAPSGVTTSFGYEWGYAFGNQYDGGSFWFTRDGGGLWRDLPTMYEFVFRTYGHN